MASSKRRSKKTPKFTAGTADKHVLYQLSVQDPAAEFDLVTRIFRGRRKRLPQSFREDFCGTALLSAHWVKNGKGRTATGIDIDPKVLEWGIEHNLSPIGEPGDKLQLLNQDVREPCPGRFDVVGAFNFSYWVFMTRPELRHYFETVRRGLKRDGLFMLDAYGGWEAQEPMFERRPIKAGFTYVWDQDKFNPIDHSIVNYIHFQFKDGTKLDKAFTYKWRYWTLPELQEILREAGFKDVWVYWDRADDEDEEDYRPSKLVDNQPGWLAYIAAAP